MTFGKLLRELRRGRDLGIKQLGPDLGVNYTYLSKLENETALPSEELIERIARYFGCDRDQLYIAANKVPEDALEGLRHQPEKALRYLRGLKRDAGHRTR